jgi:hypothetical protein
MRLNDNFRNVLKGCILLVFDYQYTIIIDDQGCNRKNHSSFSFNR